MSFKDEIPTPLKTFVSIVLLQGSVFAFFVNNKQSVIFYTWSLVFFLLNGASFAIFSWMIKRPESPFIWFMDGVPSNLEEGKMAIRRRERWLRRIQLFFSIVIWIFLSLSVFSKLTLLFQKNAS